MRREVLEETGLVVRTARRLWPEEALLLEDPCRRGADSHRWHLYEAEADGMPRLSEEGRIIGWYDPGEIAALAARKLLTQPAETFLRRL
jgi:8-oxo-dGTP pyrophosphatase MutT (NUDIX family)